MRRLRPRFDQRGDRARLLQPGTAAASHRQALRHRLFIQDADLFPRRVARLQLGAWPHAVGADRRQPGEPRPDLSRRVRRRRQRLDRHRPVRAHHAARREHDLHRREQRRVRPDQGAVLRHLRPRRQEPPRRREQRRGDRPDRHGAATRRDVRRAQLLRRQGPAHPADRGGAETPRRRLHRLHLALRRVQQPRRLAYQLRLCARAQSGGELPRRDHRPRGDHGGVRRRHGGDGEAARRVDAAAAQAGQRLRRARSDRSDDLSAGARRGGRNRHRVAVCRSGAGGSAPAHEHGSDAVQRTGRGGAVSGSVGTGEVERQSPLVSLRVTAGRWNALDELWRWLRRPAGMVRRPFFTGKSWSVPSHAMTDAWSPHAE